MDTKFHPAIAAIKSDDLQRRRELVRLDPTLATSRSAKSHPTLLQCLVLDGKNAANKLAMAGLLVDAGAELHGALYWHSGRMIGLLLERGAAIQNLRIAAGLGRVDLIESFFNDDGSLKPAAISR